MIAIKFSDVFSKKGEIKRRAMKIIKQKFPDAKWYHSTAVVTKSLKEIRLTPSVCEYGEVKIVDTNFEKIAKVAEPLAEKVFWLDVKRIGKHAFTSVEAAKVIGKIIEKSGKKANSVGMKINIEIHDDKCLVFPKNKGVGGFPVGLFGNILLVHRGDINSEVALLKIAAKGFTPFVLCPKGFSPSLGEVISYDEKLIDEELSHSLKGLRGALKKMFLLKLAKEIQNRKGCIDVACGDSLNSSFGSDHKLLSIIHKLSGIKPLLPLGFENVNTINKFARNLGLKLKASESDSDWKRFKASELDSEWSALELEKLLKKIINNKK